MSEIPDNFLLSFSHHALIKLISEGKSISFISSLSISLARKSLAFFSFSKLETSGSRKKQTIHNNFVDYLVISLIIVFTTTGIFILRL